MSTGRTTIHLVRHGEVHNPADVLYGRLPRYRLSATGREQAARTARFLATAPLVAVYSSPRLRARQTARAIIAHHPDIPLHMSRWLDEIRTSWQGSPGAILGRDFNFYAQRRHPNDEDIADIFARMSRLIQLLLRRHSGGDVVCVGHGDPIVIARTGYAGRPLDFPALRQDYPKPASVTSLTFDAFGGAPVINHLTGEPG